MHHIVVWIWLYGHGLESYELTEILIFEFIQYTVKSFIFYNEFTVRNLVFNKSLVLHC